jgi:TolB protein
LTWTRRPVHEAEPAVSGDGRWIVYVRQRGSLGAENIWVMRRDGSDQHAVTSDGSDELNYSPAWVPGSARLVVYAHAKPTGETYLVLRDLSTGAIQQLTGGYVDDDPSFSPEGTQIAFHRCFDLFGARPCEIMIITRATGRIANFTRSPKVDDYGPSWSPSGRSIAWASDRVDDFDVWRKPVAGGRGRRITHDTGFHGAPAWQPLP